MFSFVVFYLALIYVSSSFYAILCFYSLAKHYFLCTNVGSMYIEYHSLLKHVCAGVHACVYKILLIDFMHIMCANVYG